MLFTFHIRSVHLEFWCDVDSVAVVFGICALCNTDSKANAFILHAARDVLVLRAKLKRTESSSTVQLKFQRTTNSIVAWLSWGKRKRERVCVCIVYTLYNTHHTIPCYTIPHAARYNRIFTKSNSTTIHINISIGIRLYYYLSRLRSRSLGINMLNAFAQFVILCNIFHHSRFYDVLLSHYFCGAQKHCIGLDSLCSRMQKQHSFRHCGVGAWH